MHVVPMIIYFAAPAQHFTAHFITDRRAHRHPCIIMRRCDEGRSYGPAAWGRRSRHRCPSRCPCGGTRACPCPGSGSAAIRSQMPACMNALAESTHKVVWPQRRFPSYVLRFLIIHSFFYEKIVSFI